MFWKIVTITTFALVGRFIENTRKFKLKIRSIKDGKENIHSFYECLNIHLSLCLGVLGVAWTAKKQVSEVAWIFLIIFLGVASKGVFSNHKPDRLIFKDRDALWGLYIPNGLAIGTVVYSVILLTH